MALETSRTTFVFTRHVWTSILETMPPLLKNTKRTQISIGLLDRAHNKISLLRVL